MCELGAEKSQGAENHERDRVRGAVDQVGGRTEDRGHERDHNGGVKAKARVDARDERVGHGLGQGDGGDGHAGEQVLARFFPMSS